jgi:hypothetical protein
MRMKPGPALPKRSWRRSRASPVMRSAEVAESGVEVVEGAVVVDEELGVGGYVGDGGGVVSDLRLGDGQYGWDWRRREFDDGEEGGLAGGEFGDGAEGGGVEAFGGAEAVVDGEEDRGEGCRGQESLFGEGWHG